MSRLSPTEEQYRGYQFYFDYFNGVLFNGMLPQPILTFSRKTTAYGCYHHARWERGERVTGEIQLNPDTFERPIRDTLATLCSLMVAVWQYEYGKDKPTKNYCNKEWANKMKEIGLIPSDTGEPGGEETGFSVGHYLDETGKFNQAFKALPRSEIIPWKARPSDEPERKKSKEKVKYNCPKCGLNVWGKNELMIYCGSCQTRLLVFTTSNKLPKEVREVKNEELENQLMNYQVMKGEEEAFKSMNEQLLTKVEQQSNENAELRKELEQLKKDFVEMLRKQSK